MAYGDLIGDLGQAYMTNAERAAKNGVQSLAGGPIARASSQLPVAPSLAAAGVATAQQPASDGASGQSMLNPMPSHLGDIFKNPAQLAQPPQPQSLASGAPVGVIPTSTSPSYPTQSQVSASLADGLKQSATVAVPGMQAPINAVTAGASALLPNGAPSAIPATQDPTQPPSAPQTLDGGYRLTGAGSGSSAIAGRIGADGVPEFSNIPTDLASAAGRGAIGPGTQSPSSLDDLRAGGVSPNPSAPLASLGSATNLGDGIGTFSQAQAGDSQLATTRFQRAADLRDGYAAQDKLRDAQAAQTRDRNFTVVRDSAQPVTRRELKFDQDRAGTTQSLADAVTGAQGAIDAQRQGAAYNQQQRQSQRLEDAFVAATAPNATTDQKQAYQNLTDPTGANALARRQAEAKIAETQANTQKITGEANGTTPDAQQKAQAAKDKAELDQLEIQRRQTVAAQTAKSLADQKAGSIDVAREARDLANSIVNDKSFNSIVGPYDARTPTLQGDSQDLVNKANRLQSLLTLDNLKLMSGVLTDKDIEFLGRIGSGLNVTENGIKGSEQGTKDRINDIAARLSGKIGEYDKSNPATSTQVGAAQPSTKGSAVQGAPSVGAVQQGYVFLGGDPASQSSWRKQ
jgi:hypothetical protein